MTAHKFALWFHEVDKDDVAIVGGKGANLGEMTKADFPVPPGFIVTSFAYFYFIEKSRLKHKIASYLQRVDYDNPKSLEQTSRVIQNDILHAPIPKEITDVIIERYFKLGFYEELVSKGKETLVNRIKKFFATSSPAVAIRSSATAEDLPQASFAGQQSTYLNVTGEANVVESVRKSWASLFTPRAIFYRQSKGFDHFKVGLASVVQKMVSSDASGIMFTIDPVTNAKNSIIIEAILGLGELIVGGAVTPDHYVVDKKEFSIIKKTIHLQKEYIPGFGKRAIPLPHRLGAKQKITDEQILALAQLGKKLEEHYYFPQDIEWAIEKNKIFIVQTRPVTTIQNKRISENGEIANQLSQLDILLTGDPASPGIATGSVCIVHSPKEISKIQKNNVLVAEQTNPDYVPAMKKAVAIVTERGGRTSHAAIVSRELGLPCIVGAEGATRLLKNAMEITVDGGEGKVYEGKIRNSKFETRNKFPIPNSKFQNLKTATKIYVNLAETSRAEEVAKMSVDGVGLLRAEFMLAEIGTHPKFYIQEKRQRVFIDQLSSKIALFCKAFGQSRPVIYRTTDFKTNEYHNLKKGDFFEKAEANPMLGFRGTYRYIKDEEVFEMEIAAIKDVRQKMGWKNLHIMLPFVRTPEELLSAKKIMAACGLMRTPSFKLYMMVELPVNVISLEDFIKVGIDGVSIGSNDLTQLILGVDRDNSEVASVFDERNPAVIWAMEHVISVARRNSLTSSICGQAPSDYPDLVKKLVKWGITSISVNPDALDSVRQTVYETEHELISKK